ncbi:hypothetical protein [Nocardia bovistercoris]|uniref:Uncharacterized protein n=1 Tax=Nocardia bovistercoris TaxID=2785916 RepID=A0A931N3D3_9NOCA|nr:hypothetical protein [Nocardia bovistercoris]MBH0777021.1 hypothetical protein [Nocardia bovistercoris]
MGEVHEHQSTIAMLRARRIDTDPHEILRAEDIPTRRHEWTDAPLRCSDCDAVVQPVYSPPKERRPPVRPYFRRKPYRDGGNEHEAGCIFNIDERIRVISDSSADTLVRDRPRDGRPQYRLVLPEAFGPSARYESIGGGSRTVADKLTTVLNTATKIAALIEDYADRDVDPNIEWVAECRGERVPWLHFLYTPQRIFNLRSRLRPDGTDLAHPVAVIFLAQKSPRNKSPRPRSDSYRAASYALLPEPDEPHQERLYVTGKSDLIEHAFADGLGRFYIAYGMWRRSTHQFLDAPRLRLRVDHLTQVARIPDTIGSVAPTRWKDWRRTRT